MKGYANTIIDLSDALNWHTDSIVATGVESFFVSYGWFAVVLYPLASYLLGWVLPLKIVASRVSPKMKLAASMVAAWTIMFVRGTLAVWIAFSVSYFVIILVFWPMFQRQMRAQAFVPSVDSRGLSGPRPA